MGRSAFDAARGQECLDAVRAESGQATFCDEGIVSDATAAKCEYVLRASSSGTKKPGEMCSNSDDCASSPDGEASCASSWSDLGTTRQCQILARGKEGEACVGVKDGTTTTGVGSSSDGLPTRVIVCWVADGLACDLDTRTCTKIQPVGGVCTRLAKYACAKGAYCDTRANTCVASKLAGADCSEPFECAEKHFCDEKCIATKPGGQPCNSSIECGGRTCSSDGKCALKPSTATAFVCLP